MTNWEGIEEAVAIADCGSFKGAAAMLHVSSSHVSRAVAGLEDRLGSMLFNRTTRRVSLTDTGRGFVEHARRLIQERDELMALACGDGEPQGELRLTCSIAMGERFISPIVCDFADRHPRLSVVLDLTNRMVDIIGEGYDIAVRTGDIADHRLAGTKIATRRLETVASPDYLARHGFPRRVDDLQHHECLVGTATNWHFLEKGRPRVVAPTGRWQCNSGAAVVTAALGGRGICQLPEFYVRQKIANGELVPVLEHCRAEPETIWVVYPQRRHLLPKIRRLAQELEEKLQPALDRALSPLVEA